MKYATIFLMLLLLSCSNDDVAMELVDTDQELATYFDRFEAEAAQRGIDIDLSSMQIYGVFNDLDGVTIGQCSYSQDAPRRVVVDMDYWRSARDAMREFVVFHELGHCALERDHVTGGVCRSIMTDEVTGCDVKYTAATRSSYIDELFAN